MPSRGIPEYLAVQVGPIAIEPTHPVCNLICLGLIRQLSQLFLIGIVGGGVQLGQLCTATTNRPVVPAPGDYDDGEIGGMMIGMGNEVLGENLPQCRLSTTNPTCCPEANPGHRCGKRATNRFSYGTVQSDNLVKFYVCLAPKMFTS
jgi:hypothetical protein